MSLATSPERERSPRRPSQGRSSRGGGGRRVKGPGQERVACINLPHVATAIEERDNAPLAGRPLAIETPEPGPRTVYDLSRTAHRAGVRRGMTLTQARKVCPQITILPPRPDVYRDTFQAMLRVLTAFTSAVEPADLEGSWLATTRLVPRGGLERSLAKELAAGVRKEIDLAARVGLAHGKLTSRIVTRYPGPDVLVLPKGREVPFLGGLAIAYLPVNAEALRCITLLGLTKIRQYAALPSRGILPRFGYQGLRAYLLAHGQDDPRVRPYRTAPYFQAEHVCPDAVADLRIVGRILDKTTSQVATVLASQYQMARSLVVILVLENGRRIERRRTMDEPAAGPRVLRTNVEALLAGVTWEAPVERVSVAVQGLCPTLGRQLDLFRQDLEARKGVERILHHIQAKYGPDVVLRGQPLEPGSPLPERRAYAAPWPAT